MSKIKGRLIINADLVVKTGLHIGGGNSSIDIGGIDSSVIKDYNGEPYIPGSSLKGKLRSLTELAYGYSNEGKPCNCGKCPVCKIYGVGANNKNANIKEALPTRIIVRDAFLKRDIAEDMKNKKGEFKNLEFTYTESKWENSIDRLTSSANPRIIERVPQGSVFAIEVIYTIYNDDDIKNLKYLKEGFEFLEDDYLGGNGTRGYGKVNFENIFVYKKKLSNYNTEKIANYSNINEIPEDFINKLKASF